MSAPLNSSDAWVKINGELLKSGFRDVATNDTWSGKIVNGIPSGQGTYDYHASRLSITGTVVAKASKDLFFEGHCTMRWNDGTRNLYEGDVVKSQFSGTGTFLWGNGDRYIGQWQNGQRHGFGTMWTIAPSYVCVNDESTPVALSCWIGEWVDGKLHGKGIAECFGAGDGKVKISKAKSASMSSFAQKLPLIRRFEGNFSHDFPTNGSLKTKNEFFSSVCYDGQTPFHNFPVWYWAGNDLDDHPHTVAVDVEKSSEEFSMVLSRVDIYDLNVDAVQRLVHHERRLCYDLLRRSVQKKIAAVPDMKWSPKDMEMWAFHSSGHSNLEKKPWECIIEEGFKSAFSGNGNGNVYGRGNYFAKHAQLANQYAIRAADKAAGEQGSTAGSEELTCRMFMARITAGLSTSGEHRKPCTLIPGREKAEFFHSLVNDDEKSIIVIDENLRAYPAYLITYKVKKSPRSEATSSGPGTTGRHSAPKVIVPPPRHRKEGSFAGNLLKLVSTSMNEFSKHLDPSAEGRSLEENTTLIKKWMPQGHKSLGESDPYAGPFTHLLNRGQKLEDDSKNGRGVSQSSGKRGAAGGSGGRDIGAGAGRGAAGGSGGRDIGAGAGRGAAGGSGGRDIGAGAGRGAAGGSGGRDIGAPAGPSGRREVSASASGLTLPPLWHVAKCEKTNTEYMWKFKNDFTTYDKDMTQNCTTLLHREDHLVLWLSDFKQNSLPYLGKRGPSEEGERSARRAKRKAVNGASKSDDKQAPVVVFISDSDDEWGKK